MTCEEIIFKGGLGVDPLEAASPLNSAVLEKEGRCENYLFLRAVTGLTAGGWKMEDGEWTEEGRCSARMEDGRKWSDEAGASYKASIA